MSDQIKHECGIAMIRLRKEPQYYIEKYGSPLYAPNRLYVLMQKQINRGQDGAGVANIKLDTKPGTRYISRYRSIEPQAVNYIFDKIYKKYKKAKKLGGKGNILMIQGYMGQAAQLDRERGAKTVLAKYPGLKLLASQTTH